MLQCFSMLNLKEVLLQGQSEAYTNTMGGSNRAYDAVVGGGYVDELQKVLEKDGVQELAYLGAGDNAILARFAQGRLLRFRGAKIENQPNTGDSVNCEFIIRPYYKIEVSGCRVLGVYEHYSMAGAIREARISKAQALEMVGILRTAAAKGGYYIPDYIRGTQPKFEQFALLSDCTPIVIDMGAIVGADEYFSALVALGVATGEIERQKHEYASLRSVESMIVPHGIRWDGKWKTAEGKPKVLAFYPDSDKYAETGINADIREICRNAGRFR